MELNAHNKNEYPPMHTAEHILNQTMIRMFGCKRSKNSHIERKKSKCDYFLSLEPTAEQIAKIESEVNKVIAQNFTVSADFIPRNEIPETIDTSKLPADVSQTLRLVYVGDYDICACIGVHVQNTNEIGTFKILNCDFTEGRLRIRFKLEDCPFIENVLAN